MLFPGQARCGILTCIVDRPFSPVGQLVIEFLLV